MRPLAFLFLLLSWLARRRSACRARIGWSSSTLCGKVAGFSQPRATMRSQALRADLLMLLTAIIWGSSFVAQRLGMDAVGPFLYTGLRFTLATLALLPLVLWLGKRDGEHKPEPVRRGPPLGGLAMGPSGSAARRGQAA